MRTKNKFIVLTAILLLFLQIALICMVTSESMEISSADPDSLGASGIPLVIAILVIPWFIAYGLIFKHILRLARKGTKKHIRIAFEISALVFATTPYLMYMYVFCRTHFEHMRYGQATSSIVIGNNSFALIGALLALSILFAILDSFFTKREINLNKS